MGASSCMQVINQKFQIQDIVQGMLDKGKELQFNSVDPTFKAKTEQAGELLSVLSRKKALKNRKEYNRIRRSFEQNNLPQ